MKKLLFITFLLCCINVFSQTPVENLKKLSETEPDKVLSTWRTVYNNADDEGKVGVLLAVSQAYMLKGDRKNLFYYIEKAEKEAEKINNPLLQSEIHLPKATAYAIIGLHNEAEKYASQGIEISQKITNSKKRNSVEGRLSYLLLTIRALNGKEKNPIQAYKKVAVMFLESDLTEKEKNTAIMTTYYNIGSLYKKKKQLDSATYYLQKTTNFPTSSENLLVLGLTYENLGEIDYQQDKLNSAFEFLNKATPILKKFNDPNLATNYALLSSIYEKKGDVKKQLEYKNLENQFASALDENKSSAMRHAYESLEKSRLEIEEKAHKRNIIIWSITILSLFALVGLYLYLKNKKAKQKQLYFQIISKLELQLSEKATIITSDVSKENNDGNIFEQTSSKPKENIKGSSISDITEQELLKKLQKFEKSEKFTNKDLSIALLAAQLGTNTKYLSEIINKHYGKNYNTYINDLRIDFICRKIATDPEYRKFKISYLAEVSGFSTYTNFTNVFKNTTGMSPSAFLKEASLQP